MRHSDSYNGFPLDSLRNPVAFARFPDITLSMRPRGVPGLCPSKGFFLTELEYGRYWGGRSPISLEGKTGLPKRSASTMRSQLCVPRPL